MKLLHIGSTPAVDGQSTTVSELQSFLDQARRLPELASDFKYHRGYMHAQGNNLGSQFLYGIANKLSIVDPTITFQLPFQAVALAKGIIHHFRKRQGGAAGKLRAAYNTVANVYDDDKAETFLKAHGAAAWKDDKNRDLTWFRLALYEEEAPAISHQALYTMLNPDPARDYRFLADLRYCLVIFAGKGTPPGRPPTWIDLHAYRGAALACGPVQSDRWFKVGQYVPDESAVKWMQFDTKAHYMRITGRVPGYADTYWHLSGWERFKEGAKMVGETVGKVAIKAGPAIVKTVVGGGGGITTGSPASGVRSHWQEQRLMESGAGDSTVGPGSYARAMWHGHTTDFNRKSIVPPGFCFVKFNGRLDLALVRTDAS
jgi:hypothetical protein